MEVTVAIHLLQLEMAKAAVCSAAPAQQVSRDLRPAHSQGWIALLCVSVRLLGSFLSYFMHRDGRSSQDGWIHILAS